MRSPSPSAFLFVLACTLIFAGFAGAADTSTEMRCNGELPPTHAQLTGADKNSATRLELTRPVAPDAAIDLDVCSGELTVVGGGQDSLRMTVELENPAPKITAGDYVQLLDVNRDGARLKLDLPKEARARVLIVVPAKSRAVHVNLVQGNLSFDAGTVGGDRSINVVRGNVELAGDSSTYESLDVNVVAGRFHDAKGGSTRPLLANKSLSGGGSGSISVNVVSGDVDLKPAD